ncbi:ABC transporter ATP-binding protein [Alicyclobacillus macrosporangiidus]|jgi:osmoprotectant transport system ATP-binding protein|uniref:Quaternary amine transport ATP-binding protein n=1 Tax=Alicyclobacillus macrosporangiidus TaxID=392015 RepID=A0A1I7IFR2_9BACL|nr:ABC transporter ATP-binding protein [Alicyclobacillus macrosporangiidus]SFU71775.1 osmoprotectant transport system ATP-binding protein [Alicyclobacillus macrosporangiidus]
MLSFQDVCKRYPDGTTAVDQLSLDISHGELVALIGPSGCGKSTTLRMVNRLVEPSSGTILVDGRDNRAYHPVELRRRLGYVIQQVGLMPHLTIAENIAFVLRLQGVAPKQRRRRAEELMHLVGLDPGLYLDRYPRELSGGQQQRIGVLRALAHDPDIILMDEPFGALDPLIREQLQDELKRLQKTVHKTILFVTHDMDEALRIADRIVLMRDGRIVQAAEPEQMLRAPADAFVAEFIGRHRMLRQASEVAVADVMIDNPVTMEVHAGLAQALERMRQRRVNSVMVVDSGGRFAGVARLEDVTRALEQGLPMRVGDVARWAQTAVHPDDPALNAMRQMLWYRVDAVPVVAEDGTLAGLVTRSALAGVLDDALRVTGAEPLAEAR